MSDSKFPVVTLKWYIVTVTWLEMNMVNDIPVVTGGDAHVTIIKAASQHIATLFGLERTMEKFTMVDGMFYSDSGREIFIQGTSVIEAVLPLQNLLNITGNIATKEERDFFFGTDNGSSEAKDKDPPLPTNVDGQSNVYILRPKEPKK